MNGRLLKFDISKIPAAEARILGICHVPRGFGGGEMEAMRPLMGVMTPDFA